jgi:glycine/sarcosine N-methyltransferase
MYDSFSKNYDRFINWSSRLDFEMPFIDGQLDKLGNGPLTILDAACGTGLHAIALAQKGHRAIGVDLSPGMIEKARQNAVDKDVSVQFETVGFGNLTSTFGQGAFDAILCLGNSLPHVLSFDEVVRTIADFGASIRPGGLLLIQNRNFDAVISQKKRWMDPQNFQDTQGELVFLRFYDFLEDGLLGFNVITLSHQPGQNWSQQVLSIPLRPILKGELVEILCKQGFQKINCIDGMNGSPFDPQSSENLVVSAILQRAHG